MADRRCFGMGYLLVLLLSLALLCSCIRLPRTEEDFADSYTTNYAASRAARTPSIAAGAGQMLTDPSGSESLRRRLHAQNLIGHTVVWQDGVLQIDFTFSPDAVLAQLRSARLFARDTLLLQRQDESDPGYYDSMLAESPVDGDVSEVICRIFIAETLAIQDNWSMGGEESAAAQGDVSDGVGGTEASDDGRGEALLLSYENSLSVIPLREAAPALLSAAAGVVKGGLVSAQVSLQCSLTDRALLVQVKTDRQIDPTLADQWRDPLARELAQRAVNTQGDRYPVLVVQYYAGSVLYYEDVCLWVDGVTTWIGEADWINLPQVQAALDSAVQQEEAETETTVKSTEQGSDPQAELGTPESGGQSESAPTEVTTGEMGLGGHILPFVTSGKRR